MIGCDTEFVDKVASSSPTPGGGAVCAYVGALSAALASMVGNLTVGKAQYADVEEDVRVKLDLLIGCREMLVGLVEDDQLAFDCLSKSWKMPKNTILQRRSRHEAEQQALIGACEVPLQVMRVCAKIIELDDYMARHGNKTAIADAGACATLAAAALKAAALNVYVNTGLMEDIELAETLDEEATDLVDTFEKQAGEVYAYVVREVNA